jgi:hypothetical protein
LVIANPAIGFADAVRDPLQRSKPASSRLFSDIRLYWRLGQLQGARRDPRVLAEAVFAGQTGALTLIHRSARRR